MSRAFYRSSEKQMERSGVAVRSIQQYEQRQKDINKASFSTVVALASALHCTTPMDLYEHI